MGAEMRIFVALLFSFGFILAGACSRAPTASPVTDFTSERCRKAYTEFYRNSAVDLRVVYGYKDARPARFVADRYERLIFVQKLLEKCTPESYACGFRRASKDADLFLKEILGPDGIPREVFLRVIQSSSGPDDVENRKDPFQKWKTKYAETAFLSGLSNADAVFYNGHSRAGGGPDFQPPRIGSRSEVQFGWYKANEPGFIHTMAALKKEPSHLKMLGLFSCASSRLFLDRVQSVRAGLGLVMSTKLIYFSDAMESQVETLSALLGMKCEKSYEEIMKKPDIRAGGAQISGFFKD